MFRKDESNQRDRGRRRHQENSQASWFVGGQAPSKAIGPPITVEHHIDYSVAQVPASNDSLYVDPVYPEIVPS